MKYTTYIISIIIIFQSTLLFANETLLSDREFCQKLLKQKEKKTESITINDIIDFTRYTTMPEQFATPKVTKVILPKDKLVKNKIVNSKAFRNVILSFSKSETDEFDKDKALEMKDILEDRIDKQKDKYYKLKETESVKECLREKMKLGFSYVTLENDILELLSIKSKIHNVQGQEIVRKQIASVKNRLNIDWEVVENVSIDMIRKTLMDSSVANIVLVSHAAEVGYAVDSSKRMFPTSLFENISPSLMSIAFFTCHAETIVEKYNILNIFENNYSSHPQRQLFIVENRKIFNRVGLTAPTAFGYFLSRVDNYISPRLKIGTKYRLNNEDRFAKHWPRLCKIKIKNIKIESGVFNVTINRKYIGSLSKGSENDEIEFPCLYLKSKNTLFIRGADGLTTNKYEFANQEIQMTINDSLININKVRNWQIDEFLKRTKVEFR